jgi:hypothetical protein
MLNLFSWKVSPQHFSTMAFKTPLSIRHKHLFPNKNSVSDGGCFRQSLGIQHTCLRAEEDTLGVSFNAQSQAPDIPEFSARATRIEYTLSLNATQNDPEIFFLPLRALKQELSASLNAQSQAPDDPLHALDSKCAPRDSLYHSPFFSKVLQRLPARISTAPLQPLCIPTKRHIHPFLPQTVSKGHAHLPPSRIQKTPYQGFWRSEVHILRLRILFVRQELVCVLSFENLPAHEEVIGIQTPPFPRLPTTSHIHPYLPQTVSQGHAHLPLSRIQKTPSIRDLALRGSCSTSTDSICQTGVGLCP